MIRYIIPLYFAVNYYYYDRLHIIFILLLWFNAVWYVKSILYFLNKLLEGRDSESSFRLTRERMYDN